MRRPRYAELLMKGVVDIVSDRYSLNVRAESSYLHGVAGAEVDTASNHRKA